MLFQTMSQLGDTLRGIVRISQDRVEVLDSKQILGVLMDRLVWTAVFHETVEMRGMARWIIKMLPPSFGIHFNVAPPPETQSHFIIPTIQITGLTYDTARTLFRTAVQHRLGAFVISHHQKEKQAQINAIFAAAAIQEGFQGLLLFKEKGNLEGSECAVVLETVLKRLLDSEGFSIAVSKISEDRPLYITATVFTEKGISLEKQEAFLWQLPLALREEISAEIGEKLEAYFNQRNAIQTLPLAQQLGTPTDVTFSLRDEIAVAVTESPSSKKSFYESFNTSPKKY